MKILITGGLGFIGSSLAIELAGLNHKVTLLDIREDNHFYKEHPDNLHFVKGDVADGQFMSELLEESYDGVIHLAAVSRVAVAQDNPDECVRTNIGGVKTLLGAIERSGQSPWLIFGSSREVYGEPKELPVKESHSKKWANIYGKTKVRGEELFSDFAKAHKLSCAILRFSNVYGNRFDLFERVLPKFIRAIERKEKLYIEGGNQIIDFTHIDDTVHAILQAIEYIRDKTALLDDFHILPGIGWRLQDAIGYLEDIIGKKAIKVVNPERNYDVQQFIGDPSKSRGLLNLRPFLSLKEGLELSVDEYIKEIK